MRDTRRHSRFCLCAFSGSKKLISDIHSHQLIPNRQQIKVHIMMQLEENNHKYVQTRNSMQYLLTKLYQDYAQSHLLQYFNVDSYGCTRCVLESNHLRLIKSFGTLFLAFTCCWPPGSYRKIRKEKKSVVKPTQHAHRPDGNFTSETYVQ